MYVILFRNFDKVGIKELLTETGQFKLFQACKNMSLPQPQSMKYFYLECNADATFLVYIFNEDHRKIMKVDDYKNIPKSNWLLIKDTDVGTYRYRFN